MEAMVRVQQKLCPAMEGKYLIVWNKLKILDKQDSGRAMDGLKGIMNCLREEGRWKTNRFLDIRNKQCKSIPHLSIYLKQKTSRHSKQRNTTQ